MERDAEATRRRLIAAATAEFARYGIAGARVDRIAEAARSNKAQIYHYFQSKDGLFDAVFEAHVDEAVRSAYFDATDLPETAGRIFDDFEAHPELGRLTTWYRLERAGAEASMHELVAANEAKIAAIRDAQTAGAVTAAYPADVLLGLIIVVASAWTSLPPEFASLENAHTPAQRRQFVVEAVRRIVAP